MKGPAPTAEIVRQLEARLGAHHARQRLGLEAEHDARIFGGGIGFFHPENWYSGGWVIRNSLKLVGLYNRARRNAHAIRTVHNAVVLTALPPGCEGLRVLHLSDLHLDMSADIVERLVECVRPLEYDLCVLTGDYRFRTYGDASAVLAAMARLRESLRGPAFAVLGNHDSVQMLPAFENLDIHVLMNENVRHTHGGDVVHIAGIDDAHFFRADNLEKALTDIPWGACCLLLSHTPEVYRQAAHAGADLLLCGHTHGGQICLPGGRPLTVAAQIPRRLANGAWQHGPMLGYTSPGAGSSIVDVRLNCPPEVTVHTLNRVDPVSPNET